MSPRRAFPRSANSHEAAAAEVLERFTLAERWRPTLPVPVERIIESTFGLSILWEHLDDEGGDHVLGLLQPNHRRIILNERHAALFEGIIGPERFTLAHELGHWIYDADNPEQGTLFAGADGSASVFCRGLRPVAVDIREVNANKFASRLLLPTALVRAKMDMPLRTWTALATRAAEWGVSKQTLIIRLGELGLNASLPGSTY